MFAGADGHEAMTIPRGAVLDLSGKKFNGERLMEVMWHDRKVLVFTEDLKNTAVAI